MIAIKKLPVRVIEELTLLKMRTASEIIAGPLAQCETKIYGPSETAARVSPSYDVA